MSAKDVVIGVNTRRGKFRIHLVGDSADLQAVGPMLDDLAGMANSPEDFLENALPELASHNVTVVEVLDVGPKAPSLSIVERVRLIAGRGAQATSEDSFIHLLVTFQCG